MGNLAQLKGSLLPFEVLGGLHKCTTDTIKKLGQALARSSGKDDSEVTRHLYGRLSVLLMKGNASLILNCDKPHPHISGVQ